MIGPEVTVLVDVVPRFAGRIDETLLQEAVRQALTAAARDKGGRVEGWRRAGSESSPSSTQAIEVSVHVTDDAEMHRLNRKYRGVDRPTDVLSFSFIEDQVEGMMAPPVSDDTRLPVGEIVISLERVLDQAGELGHSAEMELAWLAIHGALQLAGYAHGTAEQAEHMEELERRALRALGFMSS